MSRYLKIATESKQQSQPTDSCHRLYFPSFTLRHSVAKPETTAPERKQLKSDLNVEL